ncbi:hypothetical protein Tco_1357073 [Tanacetum coccineum]
MSMMSVHISSGLVLHQMTSDHNRSELGIHDHSNEPSSSKLVPKVVPLAVKTATSRQEMGLLFHLHIAMLRTTGGKLSSSRVLKQHCTMSLEPRDQSNLLGTIPFKHLIEHHQCHSRNSTAKAQDLNTDRLPQTLMKSFQDMRNSMSMLVKDIRSVRWKAEKTMTKAQIKIAKRHEGTSHTTDNKEESTKNTRA